MPLLAETIRLSFDAPAWLLALLLLVPFVVVVAWRSAAAIEPWCLRLSMVVRLVVVTLLLAALARPMLQRQATDRAVIMVVDDSASVPNDASARAREWLRDASMLDRQPGDRVGTVSAGRDAVIVSLARPGLVASFDGARADTDGTNLEQAVRLALSLAPSDAISRIVVASDGNETAGDLTRAASTAAALGIPIDVLPIQFSLANEVQVETVDAPSSARPESEVRVRVVLRSATDTEGVLHLQVRGDGESDVRRPISLRPGLNEFTFRATVGSGGPTRFKATFEPPPDAAGRAIDARMENNEGEAITLVTPQTARVLVLRQRDADGEALEGALRRADISVETLAGEQAPQSLAEWCGFDAVIMVDQPVWHYSGDQQRQLAQAVHDMGVGLVMVGGPQAFGAGAWQESPIADALPLLLEPKVEHRQLRGALAIVIDTSGSMQMPVPGTSAKRIDLAAEASVAALQALSSKDLVAVIAFAGDHRIAVPLGPNLDPKHAATAIRTAGPAGGTDLFPALVAAGNLLRDSTGGVRHILVVSDGETAGTAEDGAAIASAIARSGITITTVGLAEGAGADTLRRIAVAGGGTFHPLSTGEGMATLPTVLIREAVQLRRTLIVEGGAFAPVLVAPDAWLAEHRPSPALDGYVVTADRGGLAEVLLRHPEGDPILGRWQHGLGRVIAFTSDASARWAAAWTAWSSFDAFWLRQLRWALRPTPRFARADLRVIDGVGHLHLELNDDQGAPLAVDSIAARIVPEGRTPVVVDLNRVAKGSFRASIDLPESSNHLLAVRWTAGGVVGGTQAAFIAPGSPEHRFMRDDSARLVRAAAISGGRVLDGSAPPVALHSRDGVHAPIRSESAWPLFALAAAVLMVGDVAVRRLRFGRDALDVAVATLTPTVTASPLATRLRRHRRKPGTDDASTPR